MKAFPHKVMSAQQGQGMELRDYFAAKAMQACLSQKDARDYTPLSTAKDAYIYADAMMEARKS